MSKLIYDAAVLLVEDNRVDAALLETLLQNHGCAVQIARGLDVVDHFDRKYDLILLDINMPGIDGFYIANTLKKSHAYQNRAPIVFVSSHLFTDAVKDKCIAMGVSGYLEKPMNEQIVAELLSQFLSHKQAGVQSITPTDTKGFFRVNV